MPNPEEVRGVSNADTSNEPDRAPASLYSKDFSSRSENTFTKMPILNYAYDAVHWHINELASRVIAQSGISSDRFHLGKILLQSLKDAPDFILQIDGVTGETETFNSALKRSVQCANAMRKMGLEAGDRIVVIAPNHIHLTMPIYASSYIGVAVAGVDFTLKVVELEQAFKIVLPKLIFCQDEKATEVDQALHNINHKAHIVTFDDSDRWDTLGKLLETEKYILVKDFKASDFDPEVTIANLAATSGTTGLPKFVALSHKNLLSAVHFFLLPYTNFPTPFNLGLTISSVQWLSATALFFLSALFRFTRLQSSLPITPKLFQDLVNKYRPSFTVGSPHTFLEVMDKDKCDLTCFERILIGGSPVPTILMKYLQEASPNTFVQMTYGLTEAAGLVLNNTNSVPGSPGKPLSSFQYRLINEETHEDIKEPNIPGELWIKGPAVFMYYYNNPGVTAETKTKDGWLKTGDVFFKDENDNFFFVERLKMLMSYMNHQISPTEIEDVIINHPGVLNVAVTKIPDTQRGDLPVAFVIPREDHNVTAKEIKDLMKDTLADSKQLRGGVVFVKEFPMTSSMKVNKKKLASMALELKRE